MIESIEYNGHWYTTENPDRQIAGTLTFSPDQGAYLNLIGSFHNGKDREDILELQFILGTTYDGIKITLYSCFLTQLKSGSRGFTSRFLAQFVFVGVHFREKNELRFTTISIHYSNLDDWADISGFIREDEPHDHKEIVIRFKNPDPTYIATIDDYKIYIDIYSNETFGFYERTIRQKAYIRVESSVEKELDDFLDFMHRI